MEGAPLGREAEALWKRDGGNEFPEGSEKIEEILQGGTGRREESREWLGLSLERVETFQSILQNALVRDPGQLYLFFLLPTGPVFWCPGSPLHGHQPGLHVCQLGHRPEPYVWPLSWPGLPHSVPMLTRVYEGIQVTFLTPSCLGHGGGWSLITLPWEMGTVEEA